jgi:phage gp29-like protein
MKTTTIIDRFKAGLGGLFRKGPAEEMQSEALALLRSEFLASLTGGLTPAKLNHILANADAGDIGDMYRLFADIEDRDEHIHAELSKRRRALLGPQWSIMPGKGTGTAKNPDKRAMAIAEAVREQFDSIPDFEDMVLDLADGIGHGFAALEIEWGFDGRAHVPVGLHHRPQTWFQLLPPQFGGDGNSLRLRDGSMEGLPLQPLGWVLHRHRSKSGWLARSGLFRVLVWTFLLKGYARGDFAEFLEIHGLPLRVGTYPTTATKEDKAALKRAIQAIGHDAAGIIPDGMLIDFKEAAKGSEKPFEAMLAHCERGQSKAILGGTLTSQADGKSSTNALGKIHDEVRRDIMASDARQIASTITQQLLMPLAVLNQGVSDPALLPWFKFDVSDPADLGELAEALPKLAECMRIPEAWAHEKAGIPLPEGDEPVLRVAGQAQEPPLNGKPKPAPLTAALTAGDGQAGFPDQDALEAATVPEATLQRIMEQLTGSLVTELKDGKTPDELLAALASHYPRMETRDMEELLARAMFVSEVWGRVSAQGEE